MFKRAPVWFWVAITIGIAIRIYLVGFTEGTYDVNIWEQHARGVSELGLVSYYHSNPKANHPPFILEVESLLWRGAQASGVPFRIFLRAPFAIVDAVSAILLFNLLGPHRSRFAFVPMYWLAPLPLIPFWFFERPWFPIGATFVGSAYIYSLYVVLCGNAWLLRNWNFAGHLYWPTVVIVSRNLAVLFFFACSCGFLLGSLGQFFMRLRVRNAAAIAT